MDSTLISIANEIKSIGAISHRTVNVTFEDLELCGRRLVTATPIVFEFGCCYDGNGVNLDGILSADFIESCVRCQREFIMPFSCAIHERLLKSEIGSTNCLDCEDYTYSGEMIDLTRMITEAIFLNFPLYNLCSDDCKGFCHKCGQNLNLGQCVCGTNIGAISKREDTSDGQSVFAKLLLDALHKKNEKE